MTISQQEAAPEGPDVLLRADGPFLGGHDLVHGSGVAVDVGQTFRLSTQASLDRVTLRVEALSSIGGELVTFRLGTFSDAQDAEMDELLWAEVAPLPSDLPIDEARWVTFELREPLALVAGRQYGFLLGFTGGGGVHDARARITHLGADVETAGSSVLDFGAFQEAFPEDLAFLLHGDAPEEPPLPPDPEEALELHGGRFLVDAIWRVGATEGVGHALPWTAETGSFWFFSEDNLELFVKVLDACHVTDSYWVFVAGLTNVEVHVRVHDTLTGVTKSFDSPGDEAFAPVLDTVGLPTCP